MRQGGIASRAREKGAWERVRIEKEERRQLGMAAGERNLVVVTVNVDDMGNGNTRRMIAGRLKRLNIDISRIQETHHIKDGEWSE